MRKIAGFAAAILAVLSLYTVPSLAQSWPQRPVKLILPLGPGSGAGLNAVKIAYKNPVAGMTDLMEGRLHFYSAACAIVRAQAQGGKLKVLAVQNRGRVAGLDLPTVEEAGFPGLNFDGLVGVLAARSSALPDAARDRIAADIRTELADPAIIERMTATGQIVSPGTAAEFAAAIDEQARYLSATIKVLGLKPAQ